MRFLCKCLFLLYFNILRQLWWGLVKSCFLKALIIIISLLVDLGVDRKVFLFILLKCTLKIIFSFQTIGDYILFADSGEFFFEIM